MLEKFKKFIFENYPNAVKILNKNILNLKEKSKCEIIEDDCFNYFDEKKRLNILFDIIFIDPPFKENKINRLIENIIEKKYLNKNGIIILHRHKKDNIQITKKLKIFDERIYGISKIYFKN